ncbi:MAG TPA: hypothetical protein VK747_23200 [Blastocatellia bacterium]|nr:hypothetical protein [Blastocatellia bacterium]
MKLIVVLLGTLTVLCAGQSVRSSLSDVSSVRGDSQIIIDPDLGRVRLKGKKLIVNGRGFSDGATIVINNEAVVTRNDSESPTTKLIAKKAGKKIPFDTTVRIYVENPDTGFTESLSYFRTRSLFTLVLPRENVYPVTLQVGDYVFVSDLEHATSWFADLNTIVRVFDVPLPSDEYWSFQAVRPGVFRFYAEQYSGGEAPPFVLCNAVIIVE